MTMQLPRDPMSPAFPAARAIEILTAEGAADVVDRSPSTIRAWADPTREACPNQNQARELDKACMATVQEAPFAEWYRRCKLVERDVGDLKLFDRLLDIGATFGLLQRAARELGGVEKLSSNQKSELCAAYQQFRDSATQMESTIVRMQPRQVAGGDV